MRSRHIVTLLTLLSVAAVSTGCGTSTYTYVKNSADRTYFKVPAAWHSIDQNKIKDLLLSADPSSETAREERKLIWTAAYDADSQPDVGHINVVNGDKPFVLSVVRPMSTAERNAMSLDVLRNLFTPVTDSAKQAAQAQGVPVANVELLRDDTLYRAGGFRGIREVYNSDSQLGPLQTFDVTAYASDSGKLYVLLIRCSAAGYRQHSGEIDTIARSFTVRSHL